MKIAVKNSKTLVEASHYRPMSKGNLAGFFTLLEYNEDCPNGRRITSCKLFEKGAQRWVGLPDKEVPPNVPGGKSAYFPYVSFADKDFQKNLLDAALEAVTHEQKNHIPNPPTAPKVSDQPSIDW